MLRDAVEAAKYDSALEGAAIGACEERNVDLHKNSIINAVGMQERGDGHSCGMITPCGPSEAADSWTKLQRQRKLTAINLLMSKIHLLRLRECNLRAVYTVIKASLLLFRGDELKVSACELSLRTLTRASDFMAAVADKLPTAALTTVHEVVSASAITSALDSSLMKVLDCVRSLARSLHECATLQQHTEGLYDQISALWKSSYWLCGHEDSAKGEKCSICLDELSPGDVLQAPPCGHVFHSSCLRKWMRVRVSCPLCQKTLS